MTRLIEKGALTALRWLFAAVILLREAIVLMGLPFWRFLARLSLLARLSEWVATLPPWGVLVAVATPFVIAEPMKIIGLYDLTIGEFVAGCLWLVAGYGISLILAERILHAGRRQLMTYRWFVLGYASFERLRAYVLSLPLVEAVRGLVRRVSALARL